MIFVERDWRIAGVFGEQKRLAITQAVTLDDEFTIEAGYHHLAGGGLERAVHNQKVARKDTSPLHRIAFGAGQEGRALVGDELFVEVEKFINVVIGRRGKTSRDAAQEKPQSQRGGKVGPIKFGYPQCHAVSLARRT